MSAHRENLCSDAGESPVPVFSDERIAEQKTTEGSGLVAVFVKIDDFSELCATSNDIGGSTIHDCLTDHFIELIPESVDSYQLPRTGFVHLMDGSRDQSEIEQILQRLIMATKSPFYTADYPFNVSISIGVARSTSVNGKDSGLLDRAQFAQYQASKQNGSACEFYDSEKAETIRNEVSLKNDLYTALEKDEFVLEFQPIVSLEDYTVEGAEALIRWHHPERGIVSPGEFIPLAERTGQILFLDRWVIRQAIKQANQWHHELDRDLTVGINLSAWQFRDNHLVDKVGELLEETGLPPSILKFEVTETSMMQDVERTGRVLRDLENLGVQVALDDFGTGHATFEYLSQFPINELKIDRSFLDFDDVYSKNQQLVEMMIQTGQRIGTNILTEGIETSEQLNFLRNRGCEKGQGFLFSRPVPPSELSALAERNEPLYREQE